MPDPLAVLTRLYADEPGLVRRAGATYPVAVRALPAARVLLGERPLPVDRVLADGGGPHLASLQAGGRVHDGPVLCLDRVEEATRDGAAVVHVVPGGYFDMLATCDAVNAETEQAATAAGVTGRDAGPPGNLDLRLRRRAHDVADGEPLTNGAGRAAACGVSVLLVVRTGDHTGVVLGRRSSQVGTDPGRWHVAPSGMLEPAADGRHLATTVATELREELDVERTVEEVAASLRVLGLVTDLARLRPDLVVLLDLEVVGNRPSAAELVAGEEFETLEVVPLGSADLAAFWPRRLPATLTAAAAGALALLEEDLVVTAGG